MTAARVQLVLTENTTMAQTYTNNYSNEKSSVIVLFNSLRVLKRIVNTADLKICVDLYRGNKSDKCNLCLMCCCVHCDAVMCVYYCVFKHLVICVILISMNLYELETSK